MENKISSSIIAGDMSESNRVYGVIVKHIENIRYASKRLLEDDLNDALKGELINKILLDCDSQLGVICTQECFASLYFSGYQILNIMKLLKDIVEQVKEEAEELGVSITVSSDEELDSDMFALDGKCIQTIILSLIRNSISFNKLNDNITSIDIRVSGDDSFAYIKYTDGRDVKADEVKYIFRTPRVSNGDKAKTRYLDNGLFLCEQLAKRHGGELTYDHTSEGGTSFVLKIPYYQPRMAVAREFSSEFIPDEETYNIIMSNIL